MLSRWFAPKYNAVAIENTVTVESAQDGDYAGSEEIEEWNDLNLDEALELFDYNCWDDLDWRADCVICYPADSTQDYRTGEWTSVQIIIRSSYRGMKRLEKAHEAKRLDNRTR